MTTASLPLCQELYALSGWADTHDAWFDYGKSLGVATAPWDGKQKHATPAYDLSYLLIKANIGVRPNDKGWKAFFYDETAIADTPEDAVAQLAIELFKSGVLK